MSEIDFNLALCVGIQTAKGTPLAAVRDATTLEVSSGALLGTKSGIGDSGINVKWAREFEERASAGNLTEQPTELLSAAVESLNAEFALRGNGATISGSPADNEYTPILPYVGVLEAMGLVGAGWGGGNGWEFKPGTQKYATVKVFYGPLAWSYQDCVIGGSVEVTGGGLLLVKPDIRPGDLIAFSTPGFPSTVNYGIQATLSAPKAVGCQFAWGATRSARTWAMTYDVGIDEIEDMNATSGKRFEIGKRTISCEVEVFADDADNDFEYQELTRSTSVGPSLGFKMGTYAGAGATQNAFQVLYNGSEARGIEPVKLGTKMGWKATVNAVATNMNGEFSLIFR